MSNILPKQYRIDKRFVCSDRAVDCYFNKALVFWAVLQHTESDKGKVLLPVEVLYHFLVWFPCFFPPSPELLDSPSLPFKRGHQQSSLIRHLRIIGHPRRSRAISTMTVPGIHRAFMSQTNSAMNAAIGSRKRKAAKSPKDNVKRVRTMEGSSEPQSTAVESDYLGKSAQSDAQQNTISPQEAAIHDSHMRVDSNGKRKREASEDSATETSKRLQSANGCSVSTAILIDDDSPDLPSPMEDNAESGLARPASFLSLPSKIRRMIYDEVFPTKTTFTVCAEPGKIIQGKEVQKSTLSETQRNLLLSCRSVSKDLTAILYGENAFKLDTALGTELFLTQLRRTTISQLTDFRIILDEHVRKHIIVALVPYLRRLQCMEVRVKYDPDSDAKGKARASQKLLRKACGIVTKKRGGKDTLWRIYKQYELSWELTKKMLDAIVPDGYDLVPEVENDFEEVQKLSDQSLTYQKQVKDQSWTNYWDDAEALVHVVDVEDNDEIRWNEDGENTEETLMNNVGISAADSAS